MSRQYYEKCLKYACDINVSRETFQKFEIYHAVLKKWQSTINIVSNNSLDFFWERHILDSLQLIPLLKSKHTLLDIGSGGGFPGMVIAIATKKNIFCIDSDKRKTLFLMEIARLTNAKVTIINDRIECLQKYDFDAVCARGFASLGQLILLANKYSQSKEAFFLKGAKCEQEILEAQKQFLFSYQITQSISSKNGVIIHISNILNK